MPVVILAAGLLLAQETKATLENCAQEDGRWVCRYRLPDVQLVQGTTTSEPPPVEVAPPTAELAPDPGVLSEDERRLVARCGSAGWLSLCSKGDRESAARLSAETRAYEAARLSVGRLLSDGACDRAVSEALAGGYFGLAREARAFCKE